MKTQKHNPENEQPVQKFTLEPAPESIQHRKDPLARKTAIAWLLFLLIALGCFSGILLQGEHLFYRDSGFFYSPFFEQIQREWNAGRLPLWDPYENLGQPLLANPTSSVFYPPKLLFFLANSEWVSFDWCFDLYVLIHFPLAFGGFLFMGRQWRWSLESSILGGLAWTFSGVLVSLSCNPVFLIGAAWLPWAIATGDVALRTGYLCPILATASVLALMCLGGDPQSMYVTAIILMLLLLTNRFYLKKMENKADMPRFKSMLFRWCLILCLSGLLAAPSLVPASVMERQTDRFMPGTARSIWELPRALTSQRSSESTQVTDGLLCRDLDRPGHGSAMYQFSQPPWTLLEFLIPNAGGNPQPGNAQWYLFLPGKDTLWFSGIYMGLIPILLAGYALGISRKKATMLFANHGKCEETNVVTNALDGFDFARIRFWAITVAVIFLLGALGGYGPVWLVRVLSGSNPEISNGDPVGGVYWFMNVLIPKFSTFRYPAKLLVPATFALAILTSLGCEAIMIRVQGKDQRNRSFFLLILSLLLSLFLGLLVVWGLFGHLWMEPFFARTPLGHPPFDVMQTWFSICLSLGQSVLFIALFILVFWLFLKKQIHQKELITCLFVLVAVDMILAQRNLVPTISDKELHCPLFMRDEIKRDNPDYRDGRNPPPRIWRSIPINPQLMDPSSRRWQRGFLYEKKTLNSKNAYLDGLGVANASGTILQADYSPMPPEIDSMLDLSETHDAAVKRLEALGVQYAVLSLENREGNQFKLNRTSPLASTMPHQYSLTRNFSEAYSIYHHDWPVNALLWKLDQTSPPIRIVRDEPIKDSEFARYVKYESSRLEMEVSLQQPGTVVLTEQYWPGWHAIATNWDQGNESFEPTIEQEQKIFRKMALPAGHWRIVMTYQPASVFIGMMIGLCTWLVVVILWWWTVIRIGTMPVNIPTKLQ